MRFRRPSATAVVAFIAGMIVATAGTAGAAHLITGKQIKNGSITQADLSKQIRAQLKKAGVPGPRGAKGDAGPAGPPGGPQQLVKDATGAVVGTLLDVDVNGTYTVNRDGGIWAFRSSGTLSAAGGRPISYKQSDCSGTAYVPSSDQTPVPVGSYSGMRRFVFRPTTNSGVGPASAWKVAPDAQEERVTGLQLYSYSSVGTSSVCMATPDAPLYNGGLLPLTPVPAPPDFTPPLSIG